jgi:hypothetical protein
VNRADLRRQHDLVAAAVDGSADEVFVGEGPVDLGSVDVGDAQVERPVDGADRFGVVAARAGVEGGHPHSAESDAGHIESTERDVFHERGLRCCLDSKW